MLCFSLSLSLGLSAMGFADVVSGSSILKIEVLKGYDVHFGYRSCHGTGLLCWICNAQFGLYL